MTLLPSPNANVVFCAVEDGAVLLSTADETYFGLNLVGARVWALLPPANTTVETMCEALAQEFPDVSPAVLRDDVTALLTDLRHNGLVS